MEALFFRLTIAGMVPLYFNFEVESFVAGVINLKAIKFKP